MTLHKLTAGSGYDYLTRQVAALDSTEKGSTSLAAYYSERGEQPGVWVGSGLAGIDGLDIGDVVTAEQMKALFAHGHHPLAEQRIAALGAGAAAADVRTVERLGQPFRVIEGDVPQFHVDLARRLGELNVAAGRPADAPSSVDDRARVRSDLAREYFRAEYGRAPVDAREVAATVAKHSRPRTTAVAGFDLTFSPVKSVSSLWAVAGPDVAAAIERAHEAAVGDALAFIERHALFTRRGAAGVQQVDVRGLVAAAFTHRDSRAGDPDLHTHVAVSNKVQTIDGDWLAIDGRVLFKANVSASETYNTALEAHLSEALGVRFAERTSADARKRPVREIVGVDPGLNARWSSRRASITARTGELATKFQHDHGRPPTPVEAIWLAQQATLETRDAKHEPRSQADQRATWATEGAQVLGSAANVARMVQGAVGQIRHRDSGVGRVSDAWVGEQAAHVVTTVSGQRTTWQSWHLRAEALRRVRTGNILPGDVEAVSSQIVEAAIGLSVPLASDRDLIDDPACLRRRDGASVFHVSGSDLFTNHAVLAAEERLVNAAGRSDGSTVTGSVVDFALLESAANGTELNPGQAGLVRAMATSGARVQLGIAAAGTGKTTAMRVLSRVWEDSGGNIVGLAPSAAAASVLGEQTNTKADTLAKIVHHLSEGTPSSLVDAIGPNTLVVIDEAGMADTLSLDTVVSFALSRGASVRLLGDDQQLAAIGAGGVLRDINHQHGAVRLAELMRFTDPAEAAASLALRDGRAEAIGFYLDQHRAHLGDLSTMTEAVFTAWQNDTAAGLSSIMLAPTRDLVADLNTRARTARLTHNGTVTGTDAAGLEVALADGNNASVGDTVITRRNDRLLRLTPTDWVKNGDRWTIIGIKDGHVAIRHTETGLGIVLPPAYVAEHTGLGYASTVHTAQGVSVDSMHGLATAAESRQQFYTMMTRGKQANHFYVITVTDGDRHSLVRPETTHPRTLTDVIEGVLARDGSPRSATTTAREADSPAIRLGQAAARYTETIHAGAEHLLGRERVTRIVQTAESLVPGIIDEPAWPTLRAHLILTETNGQAAAAALTEAVAERPLDGVKDRAAILDWRLDPTGMRGTTTGPLPWLPGIPEALAIDPELGPAVVERARTVRDVTQQVRAEALTAQTPEWARQGAARPADDVLGDVAVWRAATGVPPDDRRPTGSPRPQKAHAAYQRRLNERLNLGREPALAEWGPTIDRLVPHRDPFAPLLAVRLAAINRAGLDAAGLLRQAAGAGALPDDHATAALWWRISRHLSPAVTDQAHNPQHEAPADWADRLRSIVGEQAAADLIASPWWPTAITQIEHATRRGWVIEDLLGLAKSDAYDVDPAQALVWRIGVLTDPPPETGDDAPPPPDPLDLWNGEESPLPVDARDSAVEVADAVDAVDVLAAVALGRQLLGPLEPTDAEINKFLDHAYAWDHSPVSGDRVLHINNMTADYYQAQFPGSWSQQHLTERLGQDISGDPRFRPGHAPAGWTNLVTHLRTAGVTDAEMLAAGVATTASTGRLIDRFRDRLILPIICDNEVLGFVGRRHPDIGDDTKAGPKYLNTAETIAFRKGNQLYGLADKHTATGAIPVLVEGPTDAIAVTISTGSAFLGVAPLGTSLTNEQAAQLAGLGNEPIIATDGDLAGRIAAERDYWLLTPHGLNPRFAPIPDGQDPASLLTNHDPSNLRSALFTAGPLANALIDERLAHLNDRDEKIDQAAQVVAAQPPAHWESQIALIADRIGAPPNTVHPAVANAAQQMNDNPRRFRDLQLNNITAVRHRLETTEPSPTIRWASLAQELDPRLLDQPDWPATAAMLDQVQAAGHDVPTITRQLLSESAFDAAPAQDLRYRLVGCLPDELGPSGAVIGPLLRPEPQTPLPSMTASQSADLGIRR